MKLSVIIPVYNVEDTLNRCVESVLAQNVKDMEVILVDDGSPDNCPRMCDDWVCKDPRVRVVHKLNGGLSDARNAGLDIAKGDYITFVDSDDYLSEGTLCPLMKWLHEHNKVDMLEYSVRGHGGQDSLLSLGDKVFSNAKDYWLETMAWQHSYSWNKIYRNSVFCDLRFETGKLFEDLLLLPIIVNKNVVIATTSLGFYNYIYNNCGISKQVNVYSLGQILKAEILAAAKTRTMPWNRNGHNIYRYMFCRCYDIIRLCICKGTGRR